MDYYPNLVTKKLLTVHGPSITVDNHRHLDPEMVDGPAASKSKIKNPGLQHKILRRTALAFSK